MIVLGHGSLTLVAEIDERGVKQGGQRFPLHDRVSYYEVMDVYQISRTVILCHVIFWVHIIDTLNIMQNITNIKSSWAIVHHSNATLFQSNKFR